MIAAVLEIGICQHWDCEETRRLRQNHNLPPPFSFSLQDGTLPPRKSYLAWQVEAAVESEEEDSVLDDEEIGTS